jgi:hypothetical protein
MSSDVSIIAQRRRSLIAAALKVMPSMVLTFQPTRPDCHAMRMHRRCARELMATADVPPSAWWLPDKLGFN